MAQTSRESLTPALVTITIKRNQHDPLFVGDPYEITIPENMTIGSSVVQIQALDSDAQV